MTSPEHPSRVGAEKTGCRRACTEHGVGSFVREVNAAMPGLDLRTADVTMWNAGVVPFGESSQGRILDGLHVSLRPGADNPGASREVPRQRGLRALVRRLLLALVIRQRWRLLLLRAPTASQVMVSDAPVH